MEYDKVEFRINLARVELLCEFAPRWQHLDWLLEFLKQWLLKYELYAPLWQRALRCIELSIALETGADPKKALKELVKASGYAKSRIPMEYHLLEAKPALQHALTEALTGTHRVAITLPCLGTHQTLIAACVHPKVIDMWSHSFNHDVELTVRHIYQLGLYNKQDRECPKPERISLLLEDFKEDIDEARAAMAKQEMVEELKDVMVQCHKHVRILEAEIEQAGRNALAALQTANLMNVGREELLEAAKFAPGADTKELREARKAFEEGLKKFAKAREDK